MPSTVLKHRGLGFIIVLMVAIGALFLIVPYVVSVANSRVYPAFPFIRFVLATRHSQSHIFSDTGNFAPESSAFTLLLTLASALGRHGSHRAFAEFTHPGLIVCFLRFHQIDEAFKACIHQWCAEHHGSQGDRRIRRLNYWAFLVACLSALGALLVASFQVPQLS